jgi:hypothetical protein
MVAALLALTALLCTALNTPGAPADVAWADQARQLHVLPRLQLNSSLLAAYMKNQASKSEEARVAKPGFPIRSNRAIAKTRSSSHGSSNIPITIVVSHCSESLEWLTEEIENLKKLNSKYSQFNVFIYTKCNQPVISAPPKSFVIKMPNVGRAHHSYLFFITQTKATEGVVLFLKDKRKVVSDKLSNDTAGFRNRRGYSDMIAQALSDDEFSCEQYISTEAIGVQNIAVTRALLSWNARTFRQKTTVYPTDIRTHFTTYSSMRQWVSAMELDFPKPVTPVCYGDVFAVSVRRILEIDRRIWVNLRMSLSRGNIIQENFFMERTWAALLATIPSNTLNVYNSTKLQCFKTDICGYIGNVVVDWESFKGSVLCNTDMGTLSHKYFNYCKAGERKKSKAMMIDRSGGETRNNVHS